MNARSNTTSRALLAVATVVAMAFVVPSCGSSETPAAQAAATTATVATTATETQIVATTVTKNRYSTTTAKVTTLVEPTADDQPTGLPADAEAVCNDWAPALGDLGPLMASYGIGDTIQIGDFQDALAKYEPPTLLDLGMIEMMKYSKEYAALQTSVYLILQTQSMPITDLGQEDADRVSSAVATGAGICAGTFADVPPANG